MTEKTEQQRVNKQLFSLPFIYLYILSLLIVASISSIITYFLITQQPKPSELAKTNTLLSPLVTPDTTATVPAQEKIDVQQDNQPVSSSSSTEVILHGPRDKKQIALTFDAEMTRFMRDQLRAGKTTSYDKTIVDVLNQTNTKATFFLTGMWIALNPDITRDLSKNPLFELGSHSYTDSSFSGSCYGLSQLSDIQEVEQVGEAEFLLKIYAGIENQLFRFPGGCYSQKSLDLITKAYDTVVHWDVTGGDGFNNNTQQIINNVVNNTQNGSIIILHLNGAPTAPKTSAALPIIISSLKAKGFEFVKVNELLGLPPELKTN